MLKQFGNTVKNLFTVVDKAVDSSIKVLDISTETIVNSAGMVNDVSAVGKSMSGAMADKQLNKAARQAFKARAKQRKQYVELGFMTQEDATALGKQDLADMQKTVLSSTDKKSLKKREKQLAKLEAELAQ